MLVNYKSAFQLASLVLSLHTSIYVYIYKDKIWKIVVYIYIYKTIKHVFSDTHTITQQHTALFHMWHGVLRCTSLYFNAPPRRKGRETPSYQINKTRDFPSACCITVCVLWIFRRNINVHFTCLYQVITSLKMHTPRLQVFFCLIAQSHRWHTHIHTAYSEEAVEACSDCRGTQYSACSFLLSLLSNLFSSVTLIYLLIFRKLLYFFFLPCLYYS